MIFTDLFENKDICRICGQTPCNCTHLNEEKVRLDPKCWKGKKIGDPKTKMKGGVRVNNCVPAESVEENYDNGEYSDEAGMAHGNLITIAKAARGLLDTIDQHEDLPEWVQEKIAKVEGMLVTAWNYLQSQEAQGIDPRITEVYGTLAEAWQNVRHRLELTEEFDIIERVVEGLAQHNSVDEEVIWEDLESLTDDELYAFAVTTPVMEDWQKVNKKDKTDGMSRKAVNAYRREHPGSKLKTAVTTKPSKLKKGSKASKRRKSYCSRSRGQMKMHHISCSKTPDKAICKARRRWNCESMEHSGTMVAEAGSPAQQAAIAIAMKKAHKKPKAEGVAEAKMSPQQQHDFDRMRAGAMSRKEYDAKWKKPRKSDDEVIYGKRKSVAEMDKSQPSHGRDGHVSHSTYGSRDRGGSQGQDRTARMTTADRMMRDAEKKFLKHMSNAEKVDKGYRNPNIDEGSETAADIDKKIEFHKQGQAAAQYKGSMNKMHAAKIRELEAKKQALKQGVAEGYDGSEPLDLNSKPSVNDIFKRALYIHDYEGYGNNMDYSEDEAIDQYLERTYGPDMVEKLNRARYQSYFGRDDGRGSGHLRSSNLGSAGVKPGQFRTTKAGVMHKQDARVAKDKIKDRLGRHPAPVLPENVNEVSDDTLTSYLSKVDADSQKHEKDPTKRSPEKRNKSVQGFARAFNKLDARKDKTNEALPKAVPSGQRDPGALATRSHIAGQEKAHADWAARQKALADEFYKNHPELDDRPKPVTQENSMADELARMAMRRNPNALVRKDGETLQSPPPGPKPAGTTAPRPVPAFDPEAEYSDDYSVWHRRTHGVKEDVDGILEAHRKLNSN